MRSESASIRNGKGFFITDLARCEGGDPKEIARVAQQAGLSHVIVTVASGGTANPQFQKAGQRVIDSLHESGIQVWGLHYLYGQDFAVERRLDLENIRTGGLDGYVYNLENGVKADSLDNILALIHQMSEQLPVALNGPAFPAQDSRFPWPALLENCSLAMPDVSWLADDSPTNTLTAILERSFKEYQGLAPELAFVPTAPTYKGPSSRPPQLWEIDEFLRAAQGLGLPAVNFWNWEDCRAQLPEVWEAIAGYPWPEGGAAQGAAHRAAQEATQASQPPAPTPYRPEDIIKHFYNLHPDGGALPGLALPGALEDPLWGELREAGFGFVYLEATHGLNAPTSNFRKRQAGARQIRVPWGAFHFFDPSINPDRQLKNFLQAAGKPEPSKLPPALVLSGQEAQGSAEDVLRCLEILESESGARPLICISAEHLQKIGDAWNAYRDRLARFPLWLAGDPGSAEWQSIWPDWTICQRSPVSGAPQTLDLSNLLEFNGAPSGLEALANGWARGLQISAEQGQVDWELVRRQGYDFALIRAARGLERDRYFDNNWVEAGEIGLMRCPYQVYEEDQPFDKQMDALLGQATNLTSGDLPPAIWLTGQRPGFFRTRRWRGFDLPLRPILIVSKNELQPSAWEELSESDRQFMQRYIIWYADAEEPAQGPLKTIFRLRTQARIPDPADVYAYPGTSEELARLAEESMRPQAEVYEDGFAEDQSQAVPVEGGPFASQEAMQQAAYPSEAVTEDISQAAASQQAQPPVEAPTVDTRQQERAVQPAETPPVQAAAPSQATGSAKKSRRTSRPGRSKTEPAAEESDQSDRQAAAATAGSQDQGQTAAAATTESQDQGQTAAATPAESQNRQQAAAEQTAPVIAVPGQARPPAQAAHDQALVQAISFSFLTSAPKAKLRENHIRIEVYPGVVRLFDGQTHYLSPNRLDAAALRQVWDFNPQEMGELLFKGILHDAPSPGYRPTLAGYRAALQTMQRPLSVELFHSPDLPAYPWEYLKDPLDPDPLAVQSDTPFFRLHASAGGYEHCDPAPARPLKVLFAVCSLAAFQLERLQGEEPLLAGRLPRIELEAEVAAIRDAMDHLKRPRYLTYEILASGASGPLTLDRLQKKIHDEGFHVLHLITHGLFDRKEQNYALVLEKKDGAPHFARVEELRGSLRGEQAGRQDGANLRLVVLVACRSGDLSMAGALAPQLVQYCAPAVIAMQRDLPFPQGQLFTRRFYRELAAAGRVDQAMAATRKDLYMMDRANKADFHWTTPILMLREDELVDEGQLFQVDGRAEAKLPRQDLEDIRGELKDWRQLGAPFDPQVDRLSRELDRSLQQAGISLAAQDLARLQSALSLPAALNWPPGPAPAPERDLLPGQERRALDQLSAPVALRASDLQAHLESKGLVIPTGAAAQIASALNTGKHIILIGPPGTGKTTLAQTLCELAASPGCGWTNPGVLTTASPDWTTFDTVGGYVPVQGGALQFRPGKFLEAIAAGQWLVIDEINRADIDKAFGELFSVLSGQPVELPYKAGGEAVKILPPAGPGGNGSLGWVPPEAASPYHYVIHPSWRIIGTMNVYDKSSLFQMSFALMRRFAFIELDVPENARYLALVDRWLASEGLNRPGLALGENFHRLIDRSPAGGNALMQFRTLGPAILKDMVSYVGDRRRTAPQPDGTNGAGYFAEAFLLYVVPQLDGLEYNAIKALYSYVRGLFSGLEQAEIEPILQRIRLLYPHIPYGEWA